MDAEKKLANIVGTDLKIEQISIKSYLINYVVVGKIVGATPLILLHGANIGWGQWYLNMGVFSKYFKVYALDFPGSGKSTPIDFRHNDFQKYLVEVIEEFIRIKNLKNFFVVGHSIGGWVALQLALKNNSSVKKMILVNPIGFSDFIPLRYRFLSFYFFAKFLTITFMKPTRENMKKFLVSVFKYPSLLREEFISYFFENVKKSKSSHPFLFINSFLSSFNKFKDQLVLINDFSKINCPTLIIVGDQDPLMPLRKIFNRFQLIPGVLIKIFDAGHVPFIEKSGEFNKSVVDFFQA